MFSITKNIIFIFLTINIFYCLIEKNNKNRLKYILIQANCTLSIVIIFLVIQKITQNEIFINNLQFIYEIYAWIMIIATYIRKRNINKIDKSKFEISKNDRTIMVVSLIISVLSITILSIANIRYVLPYNEHGLIENVYFNADVHRGVINLISSSYITHSVHPLYRFILLPFYLIFILIYSITKGEILFNLCYLFAYITLFIQAFINSISAILLYKILKKIEISNKIRLVTILGFIFSMPFLWISILPETYSITLCMLLATILLYLNKNKYWILFAILTIGTNLATLAPVGIIVLSEMIKIAKKIKFKKIDIVLLSICIIAISLLFYMVFGNYLFRWSDNAISNIVNRMKISINKLIIPIVFGPKFINNNPFIVEANSFDIIPLIIIFILFIVTVIGYFNNCKKYFITNLSAIQLLSAVCLHIILGYGTNTAILYTPLYSWAFFILLAHGFDFICKKNKNIITIYVSVIIVILLYNCNWFYSFKNEISKLKFSKPIYFFEKKEYNLKYSDGSVENLYFKDAKIILISTGEAIIENIDNIICYDEEQNYISGNIMGNGEWFKVYIENDELKVSITETEKKIERTYYYIFGMGMREKFILTSNSENDEYKYKLIKYSTGEVIADKLKIDNIDSENYEITSKDYQNNDIRIWENEKGIYIKINDKQKVLDENTYINIPSFDGYKHKKLLRTLFNEIMVNVSADGKNVYPNFMTYTKSWYRDGAIAAMAINKTNNINQIMPWINSLNSIYDEQNGEKEPDNLGELLYLLSFNAKRNEKLIKEIIDEAHKIKTKEGYLQGTTDGEEHPFYSTGWLIFGLDTLNIDSSEWKLPKNILDSYKGLLWFVNTNNEINIDDKNRIYDQYQYLHYAKLHYYKIKIDYADIKSPTSFESNGLMANFENIRCFNNNYADNFITVPHIWSASEMFLYYLDLDEGKF